MGASPSPAGAGCRATSRAGSCTSSAPRWTRSGMRRRRALGGLPERDMKERAVVRRPLQRPQGVATADPAAGHVLLLQHARARTSRLYRAALNRVRESRSYFVLMFTGIVRERGRVVSFDGSRLVVATGTDAEIGDSVAIAGVCLTVAERRGGTL